MGLLAGASVSHTFPSLELPFPHIPMPTHSPLVVDGSALLLATACLTSNPGEPGVLGLDSLPAAARDDAVASARALQMRAAMHKSCMDQMPRSP